MVRSRLEIFLKGYISFYLLQTRRKLNLSQKQMAALLEMSRSGYVKLEYGKSCCNAITLILIFFVIEENWIQLISNIGEGVFIQIRRLFPSLSLSELLKVIGYRTPAVVKEIRLLQNETAFPVCSKCSSFIEREYASCCEVCGQMLNWKGFYKAKVIRMKS